MSSTSGSNTDHEMSDSSSPVSYTTRESPYSSPSQQVPQLTMDLTTLSCTDKNFYNYLKNGSTPFLHITEQPQNHFRFRYVSEMVGTHGCLLAKSSDTKTKKHPTVELVNYAGRALIRCRLAQHNNQEEHPHKLLEDEQDRDVSYTVPEKGIYKVGFPGMGIIHTAKKDVANLLYKKYTEESRNFNAKELRARCEAQAKEINLNIVRLMFSAHDLDTGKEICEPVFSDPIHNMKSAATNDLKICRISMHRGRPQGGDDVFILVEKVNKKNIMIRFYELDESGATVWSDKATFLQSDVHHQYAIVFRTPPYKNHQTPVDVKVYIELVRPTDGRTSEPKEFVYKADDVYKQMQQAKKRKIGSSFSSLNSSDGSLTNDLPVTVLNNQHDVKEESEIPALVQLPLQSASPSQCGLENALNGLASETSEPGPMWFQPAPLLPDLRLDSAEMARMTDDSQHIIIPDAMFNQYADSFNSSFSDLPSEMHGMEYIRCSINANTPLVSDSGRVKIEPSTSSQVQKSSRHTETADKIKGNSDYPAFYKPDHAAEVKELVKDLCEIIRTKTGSKNQDVKRKLDRLFEIRLSNGDTFLHMTLCSNQPSFEAIVKVIHSVKMSHLLNYANYKQQTILHLAVINGSPAMVTLLIAKGCDPMLKDADEENAIHYAVRYNKPLLEPLLDAIAQHNVPCDLNASNSEKQSALHLCALYGAASCAERLLRAGAPLSARDSLARSPLHLAAYDGRLAVLRVLLHAVTATDIDATDGRGNTALQIVCDRPIDDNTVEMVKLLLEKKADPFIHEDHNDSAFKLSRDKPSVRDLMLQYVSSESILEDDMKSEPDDDYESAEEDVELSGLAELSLYARAVASKIDAANAWRQLAERLNVSEMLSWLQNQPSPAYTLLYQVKECREDVTSKSLALLLEDMGLPDAANIIRNCIE